MRGRGWGRALLAGALLAGITACTVEHENSRERGAADVPTAVPTGSVVPGAPTRPPRTRQTSPPPALITGCPRDRSEMGDVDGDGRPDRVLALYVPQSGTYPVLELRVCLAGRGVQSIPGVAMGELLQVVDLDGDSKAEIWYGGTALAWGGGQLAHLVRGRLTVIQTASGPLDLISGYGPAIGGVSAWGSCGDGDVRQVFIEPHGRSLRTRVITWRIDGAIALEVGREVGPWTGGKPHWSDLEPLLDGCPEVA